MSNQYDSIVGRVSPTNMELLPPSKQGFIILPAPRGASHGEVLLINSSSHDSALYFTTTRGQWRTGWEVSKMQRQASMLTSTTLSTTALACNWEERRGKKEEKKNTTMHVGSTITETKTRRVMCKYNRGCYKKKSTVLVFIQMSRSQSLFFNPGVAGVEDKVHRCIKRECKD